MFNGALIWSFAKLTLMLSFSIDYIYTGQCCKTVTLVYGTAQVTYSASFMTAFYVKRYPSCRVCIRFALRYLSVLHYCQLVFISHTDSKIVILNILSLIFSIINKMGLHFKLILIMLLTNHCQSIFQQWYGDTILKLCRNKRLSYSIIYLYSLWLFRRLCRNMCCDKGSKA